MRAVGLVVLVVGCGRVNFEARHDAGPQDTEIAADAQLATDAPMLALDAGQCPSGYMRLGQSCYRYSGAAQAPTWLDGELACESDGVGAHMVTVEDKTEADLLIATFIINDFWIGLSDRIDEGTYRNVTGELPAYVVWRSGEPTSSDCAQLDEIGEFHVSTCDTSDEYVCEFDGRPAAPGAY